MTTLNEPARHGRIYKTMMEIDVLGNVALLDGPEGVTMSYYSAERANEGSKWACIFCKFLSAAVAKNHCADTFAHKPMTRLALLRAGIVLAIGAVLACEAVHYTLADTWRIVAHFI